MINPTYTFVLSHESGGETLTRNVQPNYREDLSIAWSREMNEQYFRRTLSGKLTFQGADCDYILAQPFGTKFNLTMYISYDQELTRTAYWQGYFYLTDCEIDEDDKTCIVQPLNTDEYTGLLEGIEKEYDLIPLAPEIAQCYMDKRPCIQIYRAGDSVIGCFLSGMWWEQECEAVEDAELDRENELLTKYHFAKNLSQISCEITGNNGATLSPDVSGWYYGQSTTVVGFPIYTAYREDGAYRLEVTAHGGYAQTDAAIIRTSDNAVLFQTGSYQADHLIEAVSGTGASGTAFVDERIKKIYCRVLCDVTSIEGVDTYPLPADDLCGENRNYNYIQPYSCPDNIFVCAKLSLEPTEWGIYQPGQYFMKPDDVYDYYPISRNIWDRVSIWFADVDDTARQMDIKARKQFKLRNAYPLSSVISVLLGQIAPEITHEPTPEYSSFLYDPNNTISVRHGTILITPKSNIVKAQYDQPAQKAPITLKSIMEMLRDCYRCYCFVDSQNRFRIEHIRWFMKGGQYTGTQDVGIDLTQNYVTRNGLPWSYVTAKYSFDKPEMTGRYQFEWMDDCTLLFKGLPIDIISPYVNKESIENINVSNFSSDVDYIMLNPSTISLDGFVLMEAASTDPGDSVQYRLPYEIMQLDTENENKYLQNGWVAFAFLQQYYFYDMPGATYKIGEQEFTAIGVAKNKNQSVTFPAYTDPNIFQLVKTTIGSGQIDSLTINLSSRQAKATLKYEI